MKQTFDIDSLVERFKNKEKQALSRFVSIVENHPELSQEVFGKLGSAEKTSYIVGVTGPPGTGKSTLVSMIAKNYVEKDKSVGVISVDPTSPFSGGALLGDRIRMTNVAMHPDIFIRSIGSRGMVGGLSRAVYDIARLMEAYGKDIVIIETVGAGQSEVDVFSLAYTIVVVSCPGYGDYIQVQKAGILEIADILVVNKHDLGGDDLVAQLSVMLDDAYQSETAWKPPVVTTIGTSGEGVDCLVEEICNHRRHIENNGDLEIKKKNQIKAKITELLYSNIKDHISKHILSDEKLDKIVEDVASLKTNVYKHAEEIIGKVLGT